MIYTITASPCLDQVLRLDERVEKVEPGTMRVGRQEERPGGKGIDVSRAVQALGGSTTAIAPLDSTIGQQVKALVRMEGLDIVECGVANPTRTNYIVVTPNGDEYRINTKAPAFSAIELAAFFDLIFATVKRSSYVTIGGSTPVGFKPAWCQTIIRRLKSEGCMIALDTTAEVTKACLQRDDSRPNIIKPNLIEFHDFLMFLDLPGFEEGLLTNEDIAIARDKGLSREDFLEWKYTNPNDNPALTKRWATLVHACAKFFDRYEGGVTPIISLGRQGVLMAHNDNGSTEVLHSYHPEEVQVIARVGAGDSLLGAFLTARENKRNVGEALQFAVAAATVRVSMTVEQELLSYIDLDLVTEKISTNAIRQDIYQEPFDLTEPLFLEQEAAKSSRRPRKSQTNQPARPN